MRHSQQFPRSGSDLHIRVFCLSGMILKRHAKACSMCLDTQNQPCTNAELELITCRKRGLRLKLRLEPTKRPCQFNYATSMILFTGLKSHCDGSWTKARCCHKSYVVNWMADCFWLQRQTRLLVCPIMSKMASILWAEAYHV